MASLARKLSKPAPHTFVDCSHSIDTDRVSQLSTLKSIETYGGQVNHALYWADDSKAVEMIANASTVTKWQLLHAVGQELKLRTASSGTITRLCAAI